MYRVEERCFRNQFTRIKDRDAHPIVCLTTTMSAMSQQHYCLQTNALRVDFLLRRL